MERRCAPRIYSKMQGHKYTEALSVPLADIPKVFHSRPRSMIDQIDDFFLVRSTAYSTVIVLQTSLRHTKERRSPHNEGEKGGSPRQPGRKKCSRYKH